MQQSAKVPKLAAPPPQRLHGLDSLRGLAALAVVLFHYTIGYEVRFGPYAAQPLFYAPHGHFGVELFFCISGFVILGTVERSANMWRFTVARFARMYPAYLACVVISLAVIHAAKFDFVKLDGEDLLVNATMLNGLVGSPCIDPSYWTLSYEVLFYGAAAVLWCLWGASRRFEWPCLLWLVFSLVGHCSPWVARHHGLVVLLNIEFANLFVLGMMLYYFSRGSRSRLTVPTFAGALLMTVFPPIYNGGHLPQYAYMGMVVVFCAAIWLVAKSGGRFLDIRPLVFLGEISYSLYLVHQIAGFAAIRILLRAGLPTNAAILLTIGLMVGLAFCLRTAVEKPAERWIKNFGQPKARFDWPVRTFAHVFRIESF